MDMLFTHIVHSVVAPPGELRVKAGVVCRQVKLCDPHLSALEARFSRRGAIQIDHLYLYIDGIRVSIAIIRVCDSGLC